MDGILVSHVSKSKMPGNCWGAYRYHHFAIMRVKDPQKVKRIDIRDANTLEILYKSKPLNMGKTSKSAFQIALKNKLKEFGMNQ